MILETARPTDVQLVPGRVLESTSCAPGTCFSARQMNAGTQGRAKFSFVHPDTSEGRASREGDTMRRREIQGAMTKISKGIASRPGVTLNAHRYGGLGFFLEGQELGQLHRCGRLDVSLTAAQRNRLLR